MEEERVEIEDQAILTNGIEGLKEMGSQVASFELLDQTEPEAY